jgi:DNA-binding transcriptional regulator YiaG
MTPTAIKIKSLRESTGLSQSEFWETFLKKSPINLTLSALQKYERGARQANQLTLEAVEKAVSEFLKKKGTEK